MSDQQWLQRALLWCWNAGKYSLQKAIQITQAITQIQLNRMYLQCLYLLLILSVFIGGQTRSIVGPFVGQNIAWLFLALSITYPAGYFFSGRFAKDGRWATLLIFITILYILFYFLLAIRAFTIEELVNFDQPRHIFGCTTIGLISLWAGVLTGQMETPAWMGDDLFHQHIRPKMKNNKMHLIHWGLDGKITIIRPSEINMKWNEQEKQIKLGGYPLTEYAPVFFNQRGDGGDLTPAITPLSDFFTDLPVIWNHIMSKHLEALTRGHERICWLHLLQISIPYSPTSLSYRREIFNSHSNRMNVVLPWKDSPETRVHVTWPIPDNSWRMAYPKNGQQSALFTALGQRTPRKQRKLLDIENDIIQSILPRLANNNRSIASGHLLRSITHLFLILREQIDSGHSTQADLCRRSIREISQWFKTLNTQETIIPFNPDGNHPPTSFEITLDHWSEWIDKAFVQPPTVFLRLHDTLTHLISNQNKDEDLQLNSEITGLIGSCTREVIETASQRPQEVIGPAEDWSDLGSWQDVNINRRSSMLVGIWKMLLVSSLYQNPEEVAV